MILISLFQMSLQLWHRPLEINTTICTYQSSLFYLQLSQRQINSSICDVFVIDEEFSGERIIVKCCFETVGVHISRNYMDVKVS